MYVATEFVGLIASEFYKLDLIIISTVEYLISTPKICEQYDNWKENVNHKIKMIWLINSPPNKSTHTNTSMNGMKWGIENNWICKLQLSQQKTD